MEDFQAAFFQRQQDVEILRAKQRYTASMHFGGAAVECLLNLRYFGTEPDKNVYDIWYNTYHNLIKKLRDFR